MKKKNSRTTTRRTQSLLLSPTQEKKRLLELQEKDELIIEALEDYFKKSALARRASLPRWAIW
jgi:hypothetical protein